MTPYTLNINKVMFQQMRRAVSIIILVAFISTSVKSPAYAQVGVMGLPQPGTMVNLSPAYVPLMITGLRVHPENPLLMDFIVSTGNSGLNADRVKIESDRLIKYFLACLTIPDKDQWVNLSPYEKQHIIPEDLGQTVLGQDMLAQDYLLKQLTASLIYPERNLGKNFWDKVYSKASQMYGTTHIPVNTFNKVWILPDSAKVYEHNDTVLVVQSHLKVMLDEDYLALEKNTPTRGHVDEGNVSPSALPSEIGLNVKATQGKSVNALGSQIVRQILLPAIEQEVNKGQNFAQLRQIYNSMILAVWFKNNLKQAFLNQVYTGKSKVNGVNVDDLAIKEKIYKQYLQAYKRGVFNYIKEEVDQSSKEMIPRKYFSGGLGKVDIAIIKKVDETEGRKRLAEEQPLSSESFLERSRIGGVPKGKGFDTAMTAAEAGRLGFSEVVQRNIEAGVIVSEREHAVLQMLSQIGEQDLLDGWAAPGTNDQKKKDMLEQIADTNEFVAEGLGRYKRTAIEYFDILKHDKSPFEGAIAEVPQGVDLTDPTSPDFERYSKAGMQNVNKLGFVLVAGGMGERLGAMGKKLLENGKTKVEIQVDPVGEEAYIASFAANIMAMQDAYNKGKPPDRQVKIPLFIMTSDETHAQTLRLFADNHNFGFDGVSENPTPAQIARGELKQVVIARQKSVPAMRNSQAKFTTVPGDPYTLETKPHNHVDVHRLLAQTGVAKHWEEDLGKTHFIFFQDTNGQAFNVIPAFVGVTIENELDGNILTVNRKPGDKVGLVVKMVKDGVAQTYNVEYNQIKGVLASMNKTETANFVDKQGNSLFPGNTNVLAFKASTYNRILARTGGSFSEMINLKDKELETLQAAADGQVVEFAKHPRKEAMMQDMFKDSEMKKVGFVKVANPVGYVVTKNGFENALIAVAKGNMSDALPEAQGAYYRHQRFLLDRAGVKIDVEGQQRFAFEGDYQVDIGDGITKRIKGIPFQEGAYVSLPFMLPYQAKDVFLNGGSISSRSFLLVNGEGDVVFDNLQLDGTLVINTVKGVHVTVKGLSVKNQGWQRVFLTADELNNPNTPIQEAMQGYRFVKSPDAKVINITTAGEYEIVNGEVRRLDQAMRSAVSFFYVVQPGIMTYSDLAETFGTTPEQIIQENGISPNTVPKPGSRLKITTSAKEFYYVAQEGDTLTTVAERFHTTVEDIAERNYIRNIKTFKLQVEDVLHIVIPDQAMRSISQNLEIIKEAVRSVSIEKTLSPEDLGRLNLGKLGKDFTYSSWDSSQNINVQINSMNPERTAVIWDWPNSPKEYPVINSTAARDYVSKSKNPVLHQIIIGPQGSTRQSIYLLYTDTAMEAPRTPRAAAPGGIDLNSRNLNLESAGQKVNITFDAAMIAQFRRGDFSGVKIQILDVVPISLIPLLG